jgi:sugar O-acyltransferase (sialic acid O-acetyltransferase NeuD family)
MSQVRRRILILGTRTFAEEVAEFISDIPGVEVEGFVENMDRSTCTSRKVGLPVIWVDDLPKYAATHEAVCALSTTKRSKFTTQAAALGMRFATLVHPTSLVAKSATLGPGTIVNALSAVGAHVQVGAHVIINRGVLIGHHSRIGDYATLSPGSNIAGCSEIGEATWVGMGAIVLDHTTVGAHSIVGSGAVVTKDVPSRVQVLGTPARITKEGIDGK